MTTQQRDLLMTFAQKLGINAKPYDGYSGRGMFGERTSALVVDDQYAQGVLEALYKTRTDKKLTLRIDDLGRDYIVY